MLRSLPADFWRLWSVGLIVTTVRWMETVVMGVVVYKQTGSALAVASITMLRLLPMALLGAFLGAFAERFDRRLTLAGVIGLLAITSIALAIAARLGDLEVWQLALASLVNGFGWVTDNPVRRVLMGESVGRERMASAVAFDVGGLNASRMVGPTVGGLLLVGVGIDGTFVMNAAMYLAAIALTLAVRTRMPATPGAGAVLARTLEGFAIVLADRRLTATMVVTVIYNVFGWPFISMIPVIGGDQLGLGPEGIGILTSVDGVGAFFGALALAFWLTQRWHAPVYVGPGARADDGRAGPSADGRCRRGLRHPAGDHRLPRRADRNALSHPGRPLGMHWHRADRLRLAGLARRPGRRADGDGGDRADRARGPGGDATDVADDLDAFGFAEPRRGGGLQ